MRRLSTSWPEPETKIVEIYPWKYSDRLLSFVHVKCSSHWDAMRWELAEVEVTHYGVVWGRGRGSQGWGRAVVCRAWRHWWGWVGPVEHSRVGHAWVGWQAGRHGTYCIQYWRGRTQGEGTKRRGKDRASCRGGRSQLLSYNGGTPGLFMSLCKKDWYYQNSLHLVFVC